MKVDSTIARILLTIQKELKEKYEVSLSIEHIHQVVCVQIEATKRGIQQGLTIHWSRFGKFVFTNKSRRKLQTFSLLNEIENSEALLPHEKVEKRKERIIESYNTKRSYIKQSTLRESRPLTAEQVLGIKLQSSIPTFNLVTKPKSNE